MPNKLFIFDGHQLFNLKQKGPSFSIVGTLIMSHLVPFVVSVAADGFPGLGPHQYEGVFDVVAVLVELAGLEFMLRGSEDQLE